MKLEYEFEINRFLVFHKVSAKRREIKAEKDVFNKESGTFTKEIITLNKKTVNKPRIIKIGFNDLYSGKVHHTTLYDIVVAMKTQITDSISNKGRELIRGKKLKTRLIAYIPKNYGNIRTSENSKVEAIKFDIYNAFILWFKPIEDCLVATGVIVDDDVSTIISSGEIIYKEIASYKDRKILFQVWSYE